jgi:hypothetical protein
VPWPTAATRPLCSQTWDCRVRIQSLQMPGSGPSGTGACSWVVSLWFDRDFYVRSIVLKWSFQR